MADTVTTYDVASALVTLNDELLASEVGPKLTCTEAEALATILTFAGSDQAAATWLYGHAGGDDDFGDQHVCCPTEDCETTLVWVYEDENERAAAECPTCGNVVTTEEVYEA